MEVSNTFPPPSSFNCFNFHVTVEWLCFLVGMSWLCSCFPLLEDTIMVSPFLQRILYVQLTLSWLSLVNFTFPCNLRKMSLYNFVKVELWIECIPPWSQWSIQSSFRCCFGNSFGIDYKNCNIRTCSTIYLCISNNGNHFCLTYWMESTINKHFPR